MTRERGAITWKASSALPPWAVGAVRGPMIFMNSITEPGQPLMISGIAFSCFERTCRKWMPRPSMEVLYWAQSFRIASHGRQS